MKMKKVLMGMVLAGAVASIGSYAAFQQNFSSKNNQINTANFEIGSSGTLDADSKFNIQDIAPGMEGIYDFRVDKTKSEVPVETRIKLSSAGDLFGADSPIKLSVVKYNGESYTELTPNADGTYTLSDKDTAGVQGYGLHYKWVSTSNEKDTSFANKAGSVGIAIEAEQEIKPVVITSINYKWSGLQGMESGVRVEIDKDTHKVVISSKTLGKIEAEAHRYPNSNGAIQVTNGNQWINIKVSKEIANLF